MRLTSSNWELAQICTGALKRATTYYIYGPTVACPLPCGQIKGQVLAQRPAERCFNVPGKGLSIEAKQYLLIKSSK